MANNQRLEEELGYFFENKKLLDLALTHSSYNSSISYKAGIDNERLEFIGDAYLDAIIGKTLYQKLRDVDEGYLSKKRSEIVCKKTLAKIARRIGLGEYIKISIGEERIGGRNKESILANTLESIIGAMVLDRGYNHVEEAIVPLFDNAINLAIKGNLFANYKSYLQEEIHKLSLEKGPRYHVIDESGPPHEKTFYVDAVWHGKVIGEGKGSSKKEAEQNAAKDALERKYYSDIQNSQN